MIEHDPNYLEATTKRHPLHQITSTTISMHIHVYDFFFKLLF
jgi:hypothetical protein